MWAEPDQNPGLPMAVLEKNDTEIYYTSFTDEVLQVIEKPGEYRVSDLHSYRKKVNNYLKKHQDDLVVFKLRNNKSLRDTDFKHIEKLLWHDLGTEDEYKKEFGDKPLMNLVAGLVGLERSAANELFSEFISDQSLNINQMEFVTLIVNHIVENGGLDKSILNDHPFNKHGNIIELFQGKMEVVKDMVKQIEKLNNRTALSA